MSDAYAFLILPHFVNQSIACKGTLTRDLITPLCLCEAFFKVSRVAVAYRISIARGHLCYFFLHHMNPCCFFFSQKEEFRCLLIGLRSLHCIWNHHFLSRHCQILELTVSENKPIKQQQQRSNPMATASCKPGSSIVFPPPFPRPHHQRRRQRLRHPGRCTDHGI